MSKSKPKISDLKKGIIGCPSCSAELAIDQFNSLEVSACTSCETPLFIPLKIKNYWLYRPLGGGGMGSVYRALSEDEAGEFAIKILPRKRKNDQELINTLMMEGEVGKILGKSPHIVEVVDYGFEDDEHFMASRFVDGTRLDIFISSASRLSEKQALDIMVQVIEAEIHIKNCGYLFRDMKPENIIIVEETSSAKLFDFGLCMSLEHAANPNPEDHLEGSPYYLPPERIVAAPEGEYSEVYSLGMLLFHMLTGTTYFSQADIKDLVTKHVRSLRVASVNNRLKHCSDQVIDIIDKMIKRDPNQRYHTLSEVLELIDDLSKGASGYPLSSQSGKSGKRAQNKKEKKPFKPLSALISLAAIVLLGGAIYGGWHYWQKAQSEREHQALINRVAKELNIPANIKSPGISKSEIQKMISARTAEKLKEQTAELETFNENTVKAKICKNHSINISRLQKPYLSLQEIKKRIKRELNTLIEKEINSFHSEFSKDKAKKALARQMNIKLPVSKPVKTEEEIKREAIHKTVSETNEKYPIKLLSKANMNILKKYKCYKVGDRVVVPSRSGEKIEGVYQGISGRKITVGGRTVLLADLPASISIKFNSALAAKKIQTELKRAKSEFTSKKMKYQKSVYSSIQEKLYQENGYVKSKNRWIPAFNLFNKRLKQKEKDFNKNNLNREDKIIKSVKKKFDEEKFYKEAGYKKLNGKWCSGKELVETSLKQKKRQFDKQRAAQLKELKENIRNNIEQTLYESNGYIYRDGNWIPAKKLLDETVEKKMQRLR